MYVHIIYEANIYAKRNDFHVLSTVFTESFLELLASFSNSSVFSSVEDVLGILNKGHKVHLFA